MIHHLFNGTEFTKQDFLIPFESEDFRNMGAIYGSIVQVYKIELRVSETMLQTLVKMEGFLADLIKETRSPQDVSIFSSNVSTSAQTLTVLCNLNTIR